MIIHSPKELALIVNNHRKKQKLAQATVADLVGLKQTTVSAFENRPEGTKLETLFQILSALNLNISLSPRGEADTDKTPWTEEW